MNGQAHPRSSRRGSAIVLTVGYVFIVGFSIAAILSATRRQTWNVYRTRVADNSLAAAQQTLDTMTKSILFLAQNQGAAQTLGRLKDDAGVDLLTPQAQRIAPAAEPGYIDIDKVANTNKRLTYVKVGQELAKQGQFSLETDTTNKYYGFQSTTYKFDCTAYAQEDPTAIALPSNTAGRQGRMKVPGAALRRQVELRIIPLFQFAIYYNKDMELHNGPNMTVGGPVHANGNMFLATGATTTFQKRVSATGQLRSYTDMKNLWNGDATNTSINVANGASWYATGTFLDPSKYGNAVGNRTSPSPYAGYSLDGAQHTGTLNFLDTVTNTQISSTVGTNNGVDTSGNNYLDAMDASWSSKAATRWGNGVADGSMGTTKITPPLTLGSTDPDDPNPYHTYIERSDPTDNTARASTKIENKADIKIIADPNATIPDPADPSKLIIDPSKIKIKTYTVDANGVQTESGDIPNVRVGGSASVEADRIVTPNKFYDGQQDTTISTIRVNVANLNTQSNIINNGQGIIYVSTTPGPTDSWTVPPRSVNIPAVELTNAQTVPRNTVKENLTIATDRPVYTVGDVNTNNKATLMVAADSVTVLSQQLTMTRDYTAANGSKVTLTGNTDPTGAPGGKKQNPNAAGNVTTNAVLVMGDTPSFYIDPANPTAPASPVYKPGFKRVTQSGGAHNVMRYLENLGGKTHTMNGSMIVLYDSEAAWRSHQSGAGYYSPPVRAYNWDASLLTKTPPPGIESPITATMGAVGRIGLDQAIADAP